MKKTYCFDIDGTLCEKVATIEEYGTAKPIKGTIDLVNSLYDKGHTIYLYTGRHTKQAIVTNAWLEKNGVKYHHLYLGKPVADVYVDDLAIRYINTETTIKQLEDLDMGGCQLEEDMNE